MEWIKYYSAFVFAIILFCNAAGNKGFQAKAIATVLMIAMLAPIAFYMWGQ